MPVTILPLTSPPAYDVAAFLQDIAALIAPKLPRLPNDVLTAHIWWKPGTHDFDGLGGQNVKVFKLTTIVFRFVGIPRRWKDVAGTCVGVGDWGACEGQPAWRGSGRDVDCEGVYGRMVFA